MTAVDELTDSPDSLHRRLRSMILARRFPPGAGLLETSLSRLLGVSRTPVREALARLDQEGLIHKAARGYRVRDRTPEEILEVFDVRTTLESSAAALAATRASDLELARLEELLESTQHVIDLAAETEAGVELDRLYARVLELNADWHTALRAASHNGTLNRLIAELMDVQRIYNPQMPVHSIEEIRIGQEHHRRLLRALSDHDADTASGIAAEHLGRVRGIRVREFVKSQLSGPGHHLE